MDAGPNVPLPEVPAAASPPNAACDAATLASFARSAGDCAKAWTELLASETRLARASGLRLLLAALIVPVLALGAFIALDALLVMCLHALLDGWIAATAITLLIDVAALCALGLAMRRWWRNLSLPRSRKALTEMIQRIS